MAKFWSLGQIVQKKRNLSIFKDKATFIWSFFQSLDFLSPRHVNVERVVNSRPWPVDHTRLPAVCNMRWAARTLHGSEICTCKLHCIQSDTELFFF